MIRSRPVWLALPALALLGGCQLLIGLDGGNPKGTGGTGGASSSSSSAASSSSSASSSSGTSSSTGGTGGTGGASTGGAGGAGGATSSSSSSSSGAACEGGMTCTMPSQCDDASGCMQAPCDAGCCGALTPKPADIPCGSGKFCGDATAAGTCVACNAGAQCASKVCAGHACQAPTCADGVQNGAETGVDCGPGCAPCPAVLVLAGGAPGPNGVLAGVYAPGGAWSATPLAGVTAATAIAFVPGTGDGVGVVRATAPVDQVQHTRWDGSTWTALAALNADVTQGQPALAASGGKAYLVLWDAAFKYETEVWSAGAWTVSAQPVTPSGTAMQPCGPNAPAIAPLGAEASVVFVNGSCVGALNHLLGTDRSGGVWQASSDISNNPSFAATQRPALSASTGAGPELVTAYVQQGASQILAAARTSGAWSAPVSITNGLTNDPVALAPLSDGGVVLAYRGTDGKLYQATYTGGTWSMPAAPFATNVAVAAPPAVARGVGGARAELAYVDVSGGVFHTRLVGAAWTAAVPIALGTGFTHVALASGP